MKYEATDVDADQSKEGSINGKEPNNLNQSSQHVENGGIKFELYQQTDRFGFIKQHSDGEYYNSVTYLPLNVIRTREKKWLDMLDNWPYYMNKNFDKVKERCRKGIPPSIRPRAWRYLCGAEFYMTNPQTKDCFKVLDANAHNSRWKEDIAKDIFRQFPDHELFSREGVYGKLGQEDLLRLLQAWTVMQPDEGYCQGQAPIAAALLMQMPVEDAFYCFVQICQRYLPGYYSPGLKKHSIDPVLYMIEWFMCAFCRTLPWPSVLRVWDMFFCEGVKVLFKVALVLFKYGLSTRDQLNQCPSMYETVERLKNLPPHIMQEDFLIKKIIELNVTDDELERIHYKQSKVRNSKQSFKSHLPFK